MSHELTPEGFHDLQIQLDQLERTGVQCREALQRLVEGELTPEAYANLLRRQVAAQREWERRNSRLIGDVEI